MHNPSMPSPTPPVSSSGDTNPQNPNNPNLMIPSPFPPPSASASAPAPPVSSSGDTNPQNPNNPNLMISSPFPPYPAPTGIKPFYRHLMLMRCRGQHLSGGDDNNVSVYDIDARLGGDDVQNIVKYMGLFRFDPYPAYVLGRRVAFAKPHICFGGGPHWGSLELFNTQTFLTSRTVALDLHQRVTDLAFFAEDVPLLASASVNGRVCIWKFTEEKEKDMGDYPKITSQIVIDIQIVGEEQSFNPRVCWHCQKQEILVVGIGERVLKIDTTKVGKGEVFSEKKPLRCPVDRLVEGVQLVGTHDGEVTDLSMSQWMSTTLLVSASVDGMIKVWKDSESIPIAVLSPHGGQPVYSVTFLAPPNNPGEIILITGGPLNRELKIWTCEEGQSAKSWHCNQTLELKSSAEPLEEAFFNQVLVISQGGLIFLANAKKNSIYAVHLEYGPNPASTRMDYIAEFTVSMPTLGFTWTIELLPDGEQVVLLYCVHTHAIRKYALYLSQCLPPLENPVAERPESSTERDLDALYDRYLQEESERQEKQEKLLQQMTNMLSDLPRLVQDTVKNELSGIDQTVVQALTPIIEKAVSEAFQGVGDKSESIGENNQV
ncbi:PREDICTED: enhancer of mRNA-decapping protein 4-like isoform X2 [Ipomoea nil]|uniref:enhancer of mRNA-decapping protein 4-like isoform X2 n=1 Tax=Ipomoea nil TaxID=35883 RepID=UPI0009014A16|nr:PREDICTED: enhancer of mRNA-decapping protein 4-like isoform X2 [Ipomoea nil]